MLQVILHGDEPASWAGGVADPNDLVDVLVLPEGHSYVSKYRVYKLSYQLSSPEGI